MEEKRVKNGYYVKPSQYPEAKDIQLTVTEEHAKPFKEKLKSKVYRGKLLYSMILTISGLASGLYIGEHGPTFLDIQVITNTDLEEASVFFTGGNAGILAGCLITGFIYNKMSMPLLMFFTSLGLGTTNIALPYCTQYEMMLLVRFVSAVFMGGVATGTNIQHMSVWGPNGNGLLIFLHFGFSVGGMISPLFAEPFLLEKGTAQSTINYMTNTRSNNESILSSNATTNRTSDHQLASESRIEYVFYITGIFIIITAIPYLFIYFQHQQNSKENSNDIIPDTDHKFSQRGVPFSLLVFMLVGYCVFILVWNSVESTFFAFLMTFLVEEYTDISKSKGAIVTSISWATYAAARFSLIFLTRKFTPFQLLFTMSTLTLISFSTFTILAYFGMSQAVMVFAPIASIMMSGMFPVGLSWAETELFHVTGIAGSCILVANSLGATLNPVLLGTLMEQYSNMWFGYLLLMETFLSYFILVTLSVVSRCYVDRRYGSLAMTNKTHDIIVQPDEGCGDDDDVDVQDAHVETNFIR